MECARPLTERLIYPIRVGTWYLVLILFHRMVWAFNGCCSVSQLAASDSLDCRSTAPFVSVLRSSPPPSPPPTP